MDAVHSYFLRPTRRVLGAVLPREMIFHMSHQYVRDHYLNLLDEQLSPEWVNRGVSDGPPMSTRLRLLTRSLDRASYEAEYPTSQFFYESYRQVFHFFKILMAHGFNLRTCGSILDFGCGSARILRLYRYLNGVRLVGTDANPECIAWCREQVSGCEFHVNDLVPPLPFCTGGDFDLIISLSVFTHIPIEQQREWLQEMKRVLKPNGFLLCTVVGNSHIDSQLGANGRRIIEEKGEITLGKDDPGVSLSTTAGGSNFDVFQRRDRVIDVFGSVLQLRDYIPSSRSPIGQDLLVLQKTS
jgi:SAM-dependent methyltransferase